MMTIQQMRDIPIGGKVWYSCVDMCKAPSVQLYINDRPRAITKVEVFPSIYGYSAFRATGLPRGNSIVEYKYYSKHLFLDEKSALEYYCEEIQKATKEIAKRKREYCKNANAYAKKIQDDAIRQMNDFLNRSNANAD